MYPFGPRPDPEDPQVVLEEPTVGDLDDVERIAQDPVLRWRASRLAAAGLNPRQARALALDRTVDKDEVIGWLEAGCDPDTAFDLAS